MSRAGHSAPRLRHGAAAAGALPVPLTPLVRREREVAAVCALLAQPHIRLVTLHGPGGIGKTRLAIAVASALVDSGAPAVTFVPLAPIREPTLVLATIEAFPRKAAAG